jgi:hypothetical protein
MVSNQQKQHGEQPNNEAQNQWLIARLLKEKTIVVFLVLCVFGLGLMLITLIIPLLKAAPTSLLTQVIQQIGIALFVTSIISIVVANLIDNTRNQLENQVATFLQEVVTTRLDRIQNNAQIQTKEQTENLIATSKSLQAMGVAGISRMYEKREDAIDNIRQDLANLNLSRIDLIGISLNDFVRDSGVFHEIWKVIAAYARGERELPKPGGKLDIRILIVDPNCHGAYLRSSGEQRDSSAVVLHSRLAKDIDFTVDSLLELEEVVNKMGGTARISFAFRLYQLPPMFFLLRTDISSYVQPYYFWRTRDPIRPTSLVRYTDVGEFLLHSGMNDHFEWIWKKASISSSEYLEQYQLGVDKGLHQSGVINVFDNAVDAKKRILWLIRNPQNHRLYIQGFSLRSYFDGDDVLYWAIKQAVERDDVDIKVLLINPNSDQAIYRSFREYLLEKPGDTLTFEEFKKDKYKGAQLYRETERSVRWIRRIASPTNKFLFKWYDSAPFCFMLMVDNSVLVEQYHYGKVGPSEGSTILGKDMALFEYACTSIDLYDINKPLQTYQLMENHFNFVFDKCAQEIPPSFGM